MRTGRATYDPSRAIDPVKWEPIHGPLEFESDLPTIALGGDESLRLGATWVFSVDGEGSPNHTFALSRDYPWCAQTGLSQQRFEGTVGPRTDTPTFAVFRGVLGNDVLLPWEDVGLDASEGIDPKTWLAGAAVAVAGVTAPLQAVAVPGTTLTNRLRLDPSAWADRVGRALHFVLPAGVTTPDGRAGNSLQADLVVADVGAPLTALPSNGSALPFKRGFASLPAGDPSCEAGQSCAFGHFDSTAPRMALAGRIALDGKTRIHVRILNTPGGTFPFRADVRVLAATPSGTIVETSQVRSDGSWSESTVVVAAGLPEVGLLVLPSHPRCTQNGVTFKGDITVGAITTD